jgi:hypothetical protein
LADTGEAKKYPDVKHWVNHLLVSPDSQRVAFLHRWRKPGKEGERLHQFLTADPNGTEVRILNDERMTSHFIWRDAQTLLAWADCGGDAPGYYLIPDRSDPEVHAIGVGRLIEDGHMSYRPGGSDWFVSDTYPSKKDRCRELFLFNESNGEHLSLGRFFADPAYDGPERCDLHPRWSRDGASIFFDSIHKGNRQIYRVCQ